MVQEHLASRSQQGTQLHLALKHSFSTSASVMVSHLRSFSIWRSSPAWSDIVAGSERQAVARARARGGAPRLTSPQGGGCVQSAARIGRPVHSIIARRPSSCTHTSHSEDHGKTKGVGERERERWKTTETRREP